MMGGKIRSPALCLCPVLSCGGASCPMLRVLPQCCNNTPQCCLKYSWPGRPNGSEPVTWISYYRPPLQLLYSPRSLCPERCIPLTSQPLVAPVLVPGLKVPPSLFLLVQAELIAIVCDCLACVCSSLADILVSL